MMHHSSTPVAPQTAKWRTMLSAGKRKFITIGVAAVIVLVLLWLGLLVAANAVAGSYQAQAKTYKSSVTSQLSTSAKQINGVTGADTASLAKVQQTLESLQKELSAKNQNQPKLSGVPLGGVLSSNYKSAQKQQGNTQKAMTDLVNAVSSLVSFGAYNQKVSDALAPILSQKSLAPSTYTGEQAIWQTAAIKLSAITPPAALKTSQDKLKSTLNDNAALWQQLDAAYKATDVSKFNDLQSKLGQATMTLMQQATPLKQYQTTLQQAYSAAYGELINL